jgi:trimeric autotransporter adhesin
MQRLLTLVFLFCLAVPAGITISGCTRNPAGNYCNGEGFGLKITAVQTIILTPQTTGISLAYGQTQQLAGPSAKTCKGTTASVASYTYGTTNNQIVDVSPTGNLCAGTWNRRSGGGIPDFTICNKPNPLPSTNGLPYSSAYVTATGDNVTSNQVTVFTHAQVTSTSLVLEQSSTNPLPITEECLSQPETRQLDAVAYYTTTNSSGGSSQVPLCAPTPNYVTGYSGLPSCSTAVGNLAYTSQSPSVATIDEFGVITAVLPGTTYITASVAGSASTAGYFSTCPPATISISLNGATTGTVTQGVPQTLVTTVTDTKGNTIQGLSLDYQSTNPLDISVASTGTITANFAGQADIYAVCQPSSCNPSPIDKVGVAQTGVSITSDAVTINTPGLASDYVWMSSPASPAYAGIAPLPGIPPSAGSQYFVPVELVSGTLGSPVKMPYVPNSMIMDRTGLNLYFGSSHELMIYTASNNGLSKEDPNVPGIVLAAAPNNGTILINDPIRQLFYLYTPSSGTFSTFSGVGTAAQWTPDSKTLYVVGYVVNSSAGTATYTPTLFVNNLNTGWTTYKLGNPLPQPPANQSLPAGDLAVAIPGIGAFLSSNATGTETSTATTMNAWCPSLIAGTNTINLAYPPVPLGISAQTDVLAATSDGNHILGLGLDGGTSPTLTDISVDYNKSLVKGACPSSGTNSTNITTSPVTQVATATPGMLGFTASTVNQVVVSPATSLAFLTYTATSGSTATASLPYYEPTTSGALGPINQIPFVEPSGVTAKPTAPLAGVFGLDNQIFFVSTSGDNLVHYISVPTLTDSQQINPGLLDLNGNPLPATVLVTKPRPTT